MSTHGVKEVDDLPVKWTGADGTTHEISLDYAAQIAKWMFDTHGDVPQVDAVIAGVKAEPDMRAICEALGFDPTNHHNAAKCPYCRPAGVPGTFNDQQEQPR